MSNKYYESLSDLEQRGVHRDYVIGWASGFHGNPEIEEQRRSDAWSAGYEAGKAQTLDGADEWRTEGAA